MTDVKIGHMCVPVPEGFEVVSREDRSRMNFIREGDGEVLRNNDKHIVLSIACKKHNALLAALAGTKDAVKSMEKQVASAMAPYGYALDTFAAEDLGGKTAEAFQYHYTAQEIPMSGTSMILKEGGIHYYVHAYYRTQLQEESRAILQDICHGISWE